MKSQQRNPIELAATFQIHGGRGPGGGDHHGLIGIQAATGVAKCREPGSPLFQPAVQSRTDHANPPARGYSSGPPNQSVARPVPDPLPTGPRHAPGEDAGPRPLPLKPRHRASCQPPLLIGRGFRERLGPRVQQEGHQVIAWREGPGPGGAGQVGRNHLVVSETVELPDDVCGIHGSANVPPSPAAFFHRTSDLPGCAGCGTTPSRLAGFTAVRRRGRIPILVPIRPIWQSPRCLSG